MEAKASTSDGAITALQLLGWGLISHGKHLYPVIYHDILDSMGWEGSNECLWWQALISQKYIGLYKLCVQYIDDLQEVCQSSVCVEKKWQYQVFS